MRGAKTVVVKTHVGPFLGGSPATSELKGLFAKVFKDAVIKILPERTLRIGDDWISRITYAYLKRLHLRLVNRAINARLLASTKREIYESIVQVENLETGIIENVSDFKVHSNGFLEIPAGTNPTEVIDIINAFYLDRCKHKGK